VKWFRVEDMAEGQVVLVLAHDVREACRVYMDNYPPDLYAKPATDTEITTWLANPTPWEIE
jgi:hypothetical protein